MVAAGARGDDPGAGLAAGRAGTRPTERPSPQRIVSLTPSVTETLFALGAGRRVVGVSSYCDYPPEVSSLPRVGTFLAPLVEQVIALQPDLVITSPSPGNKTAVEALERAGIGVSVVSEGSASAADVRAAIRQTAALIDADIEAEALVASLDGTLLAIRAAVADLPRPKVAVVVGYDPLILAGPQSYLGDLVAIAGGQNVVTDATAKWPRMSWEFLLAAAPEVIIDASSDNEGMSEAESLARHWARFDGLPAVRDHRLYGPAGNLLLRPGPRLGDAARVVAGWIHPDAWTASR